MLPAANRPLLEYVVSAVADAGLDEVVLVVGYRKERIQSHFGDGDDWDVELTYVEQSPQRGTGDALLQAEALVGDDFVALNGDRIIDADLVERVCERREETGDVVMAVTESDHPEDFGVVSLEDDRVVAIQERPPLEILDSKLINAGVYGFGPAIFAALRDTETRGELGLTTTLAERLDTQPVRPVRYRGRWLDVSTPWDLLDANGSVIDRGEAGSPASATIHDQATVADATVLGSNVSVGPNAAILRGTALGENVSVGPNAVLNDALVLPDASIGPATVLSNCIVGANARVGAGTVVEGGRSAVVLDETIHQDVRFGGLVGDNAAVGGNVTVQPGTIVGNDARVEGGAVISGCIASGAEVVRG
jgi:glucose-1-phosphate thymidylyltransferase